MTVFDLFRKRRWGKAGGVTQRESRMQMTSIPGPQIVSVAENGRDVGIALESGSTSGSNAGHASTHDRAETPSEGTVESTKPMPANLRLYDMAINEAPQVIDQLGVGSEKTDTQDTIPCVSREVSRRRSEHSQPLPPFLRPTPLSWHCSWQTPSRRHT